LIDLAVELVLLLNHDSLRGEALLDLVVVEVVLLAEGQIWFMGKVLRRLIVLQASLVPSIEDNYNDDYDGDDEESYPHLH
jgi:hypothetical protein